jgi:hypothetical protein
MPRDLRFALRRLARSPAFAAAAVTCLALGIGANTAIFSVINAVLLRSLPYEEPERLVGVWEANHFRRSERNVVSPANYLDWQSGTSSFSRMAAVHDIGANLTGAGEPEAVCSTSWDFGPRSAARSCPRTTRPAAPRSPC